MQGDTSSAFIGGLSAFYHQIPVGHVEAGLRTGDRYSPFPEEMNRTLLTALATWHFAPTRDAATRLRREGVPASTIHVTGNTVVDALRWMAPRCRARSLQKLLGPAKSSRPLILVTCHRRESFGAPLRSVATGLATLARGNPDARILFPIHPNPSVRATVTPLLSGIENVILCRPLAYDQFLVALQRAYLVISDSGGVQEEATALGIPVLVLRHQTERPEGLKAGTLKLVGTDARNIIRETQRLLDHPSAHRKMRQASNIFGDGQAAQRIARVLESALGAPASRRRAESELAGRMPGLPGQPP